MSSNNNNNKREIKNVCGDRQKWNIIHGARLCLFFFTKIEFKITKDKEKEEKNQIEKIFQIDS